LTHTVEDVVDDCADDEVNPTKVRKFELRATASPKENASEQDSFDFSLDEGEEVERKNQILIHQSLYQGTNKALNFNKMSSSSTPRTGSLQPTIKQK